MPTLEWIGKEKVINHHLDVPYRVLERNYSFDENGQHLPVALIVAVGRPLNYCSRFFPYRHRLF